MPTELSSRPGATPWAGRLTRPVLGLPLYALVAIIASLGVAFYPGVVENKVANPLSLGITLSLFVCAYALLSRLMPRPLAVGLVLGIVSLLRFASDKKEGHTWEPLIFGDLGQVTHLSIALKYVPQTLVIMIALLGALLVLTVVIYVARSLVRSTLSSATALVALALVCILPSRVISADALTNIPGVTYYGWNWPVNVDANGIVLHLLQTSVRPAPERLTGEQEREMAAMKSASKLAPDAPAKFIMVLCESCWYDKDRFRDVFNPLLERGAVEMRSVSPVFGGGTPNATLELLSGLPMNNPAVSGIVYQEYRDHISNDTSTLPALLRRDGYRTISAHNFEGAFWFRNVVETRLGFSAFYDARTMLPGKTLDSYPHDDVLFDLAQKKLDEQPALPDYMHLATVYTHGPYEDEGGDRGDGDYARRMGETITSLASFVDTLRAKFPDAVVVVYGDHKPALDSLQSYRGMDSHSAGDSPILILDPDADRVGRLKSSADNRPFYCLGSAISEVYFSIRLPASFYTQDGCAGYTPDKYAALGNSVPAWIYSGVLFNSNSGS